MRYQVQFLAMVGIVLSTPQKSADINTEYHAAIEYPGVEADRRGVESILVRRDGQPGWPGIWFCKQTDFKKPCQWVPTGGNGALDCKRIPYTEEHNPNISMGPDKGVLCRVYNGDNCEPTTPMMNMEWPGGTLMYWGKMFNKFKDDGSTIEGFFSYRCRGYQQTENDAAQSKYLALPKAP
jgi:hypothetical protein